MLEHKGLIVIAFENVNAFDAWLKVNHTQKEAIWIRIYKKQSGIATITYPEAVETSLCWGWIDGLANKWDESSYLVRFSMRRAKSIWSQINTEKVEALTAAGLMQASGLEQVENAKRDGRWARAYASSSKMEVPEDFIKMLKKDKEAFTFYKTLNKANIFAIAFKITTAKAEKRKDKMLQIFERLKNKKAFYP